MACADAAQVQVLLKEIRARGTALRCIIFVRQRITTHVLQHFLNNHPRRSIHGLKTAAIHAASTPATCRLRVTPSDLKQRIGDFARGDVSVLLSTQVAEEGMDISAANCVVRFDEVQTPVSFVQSRGRGRQANSSFLLMKVRCAACMCIAWHPLPPLLVACAFSVYHFVMYFCVHTSAWA